MIKRFKAIPPYRQYDVIIKLTGAIAVNYEDSFDSMAGVDPERVPSINAFIRFAGGSVGVKLTSTEYNEVIDMLDPPTQLRQSEPVKEKDNNLNENVKIYTSITFDSIKGLNIRDELVLRPGDNFQLLTQTPDYYRDLVVIDFKINDRLIISYPLITKEYNDLLGCIYGVR